MERRIWLLVALLLSLGASPAGSGARLFVGLEGPGLPTRSSDLVGFPDVTYEDHFAFDVSGAAATPEGLLYLCNGAFTTRLYRSTLDGPPEQLATIEVDISALAYGRGTLWGYSNYADPKGIYAIDPETGGATLVLDVYTGTGFRFFALGFNTADGLLYGYTEYGDAGLYAIDLETSGMVKIAGTIPAGNGQGRGLAVGENTVYLTATRGDEEIPCFAYDLSQGPGGEWIGFTNPYPDQHATGAAAWIPDPASGIGPDGSGRGEDGSGRGEGGPRFESIAPNPFSPRASIVYALPDRAPVHLAVFTASGRRAAVLIDGIVQAGRQRIEWDGTDALSRPLPAGLYIVRLEAMGIVTTGKLVLTR